MTTNFIIELTYLTPEDMKALCQDKAVDRRLCSVELTPYNFYESINLLGDLALRGVVICDIKDQYELRNFRCVIWHPLLPVTPLGVVIPRANLTWHVMPGEPDRVTLDSRPVN